MLNHKLQAETRSSHSSTVPVRQRKNTDRSKTPQTSCHALLLALSKSAILSKDLNDVLTPCHMFGMSCVHTPLVDWLFETIYHSLLMDNIYDIICKQISSYQLLQMLAQTVKKKVKKKENLSTKAGLST